MRVVRGKPRVVAFGRSVSRQIVSRAFTVLILALATVLAVTCALSLLETGNPNPDVNFENLLYESTSAFATVGLSASITGSLSPPSQLLLCALMYAGRVGPLTLVLAFARRAARAETLLRYPKENIMVG
jgi:trk system potassium uptake protein TrkH